MGGPARHVVWLTEALQDTEFQSTLVAGTVPAGEEDMASFAAEHGVEPVYIREMSRELSPRDIVTLYKLFRRLRIEKPDIVHTHTAKAGAVGRLAVFLYRWMTWGSLIGRPRKVKTIHTFHGHVFHSYYGRAKTALFLAVERFLARVATDRILVISDQQLHEINFKYRVGQARQFSVVRLGIDLTPFRNSGVYRQQKRAEIGASADEIVVGFVGRLTEIKNLSLLLKVAAVCGDVPNLKFAVVGDGHLRSRLEAETESLGLKSRVVFLGNRTDISRIYSAFDILALTSLNEGTPLSLIEAMAAEKPVISTAVGGVCDLIGDPIEDLGGFTVCERGIRIDSFRPEDYCKGLNYLVKNERLRAEMGSCGLDFVQSMYSKERLVGDIRQLYRELQSSQTSTH